MFYEKCIHGLHVECRGDSGTVIWSKGFLQTRCRAALGWLQEAGVTLNKDKCELNNSLLGHNVGQNGIQANPQRTKAIDEMNTPRNISELRRFLGMVNQMGKFSSKLAKLSQPLRELFKNDNGIHNKKKHLHK